MATWYVLRKQCKDHCAKRNNDGDTNWRWFACLFQEVIWIFKGKKVTLTLLDKCGTRVVIWNVAANKKWFRRQLCQRTGADSNYSTQKKDLIIILKQFKVINLLEEGEFLYQSSELQVRIELTTLRVLARTLQPLSYWKLCGEKFNYDKIKTSRITVHWTHERTNKGCTISVIICFFVFKLVIIRLRVKVIARTSMNFHAFPMDKQTFRLDVASCKNS